MQRHAPYADQNEGDDESAGRINPPGERRAACVGQDTEAVDKEVVAMVFPKDADCGEMRS